MSLKIQKNIAYIIGLILIFICGFISKSICGYDGFLIGILMYISGMLISFSCWYNK